MVTELLTPELERVLADTAKTDDGVTTRVVAGLVDVAMTVDVIGVLRAGQSRTLDAQAVMMATLVLKTVVSGMMVVVGFMVEVIMLDEAMELLMPCTELVPERLMLCVELMLELELTVLLMILMLL